MTLTVHDPRRGRHLAAEVEEFIRSAVDSGELKPGQKLGSARQLAKKWNTSYGAVRQSLEALAAKGVVERRTRAGTFISQDLSVGRKTTGIIGLLVPDIRIPEYSLISRHLQDACHQSGLEVLVSSTDDERERYDQSVLRHLKAGVGGLVLVAPRQDRISLRTLLEIEKSGVPVVNYARTVDVAVWPTVQTDVVQSVYLPVKHVCDLGRRRIALVSYSCCDIRRTQMQCGFYRALAESGLSAANMVDLILPDTLYLNGWADRSSLSRRLHEWLDETPGVDAICCMHDHIAATMLAVLAERGVRVPQDVAVTGAGNMAEYFGLVSGDLSTVNTCLDQAAVEMVQILQRGRNAASQDRPAVTSIQPRLIVGRSTTIR